MRGSPVIGIALALLGCSFTSWQAHGQNALLRIGRMDRAGLEVILDQPAFVVVIEKRADTRPKIIYPHRDSTWVALGKGTVTLGVPLDPNRDDQVAFVPSPQCLISERSANRWTVEAGTVSGPTTAACGPLHLGVTSERRREFWPNDSRYLMVMGFPADSPPVALGAASVPVDIPPADVAQYMGVLLTAPQYGRGAWQASIWRTR